MSSGSPPVWAPEDGSVNSGSLELSNDGIVQQCTAIGESVPVRLSADVRVDSGTIDNYCAAFAVFYQGANCTGALLEFDFVSCQTSMTGCPTSWSSLLPASGPGTSVLLISPPTTLSAGAQLLCNGAVPFTTRFDNVILEIGIFADGFESGDLLFWSATFP